MEVEINVLCAYLIFKNWIISLLYKKINKHLLQTQKTFACPFIATWYILFVIKTVKLFILINGFLKNYLLCPLWSVLSPALSFQRYLIMLSGTLVLLNLNNNMKMCMSIVHKKVQTGVYRNCFIDQAEYNKHRLQQMLQMISDVISRLHQTCLIFIWFHISKSLKSYCKQSYWDCFGLYPSSCMWKTNKSHNVSETGSVSVLRWMGQDKPTQLGPLERASLNHWTNPGPWKSTYKQPTTGFVSGR
jgi:hypothetical protein